MQTRIWLFFYFYSNFLYLFSRPNYILFIGLPITSQKNEERKEKMKNISPEELAQIIASRLDNVRLELQIPMRDLAKRAEISYSTLYNILHGTAMPNIYTLYNICLALNVSLSNLLSFEDNSFVLQGKENLLVKIFREISPMSRDTLIKVSKCMK